MIKKRLCILWILTGLLLAAGPEPVFADTWSQAEVFYHTYGNSAVFQAEDESDGGIYLATMGRNATTNTKFKTIGWRMRAISGGNTLQTLYMKNNGGYLLQKDSCSKGGYTYILYRFQLGETKQRLNSAARSALQTGKLDLVMDACMVVVKNGSAGGSMTDSGSFQGKVYTDYSGIAEAENWGSDAKASLRSYFNKHVKNLFYTITLTKGNGISSVTGGGTYCHGTKVTISCKVSSGYSFVSWTGTKTISSKSSTFCVSRSMSLKAGAKKKQEDKEDKDDPNPGGGDSGGGGGDSGGGGGDSGGGGSGYPETGEGEEDTVQNLYPPVIVAGNRYFTLKEAQSGRVTEAVIRSAMYAYDIDDGCQVSLYIDGLDTGEMKAMTGSGRRKLTLYAVDSGGLVSRQEVTIYIFQTDMRKGCTVKGKIRFISTAWYMDSEGKLLGEEEGGLKENSVWRKDPTYASLLNSVIGR